MTQKRTAVVLMNVGTPDSPRVKDVRNYLFQFLNDRRVIDLPLVPQKLLVNLIIVPFRAPKSAKLYRQLWTSDGSPLLYHGEKLQSGLQEQLGNDYQVFLAMRYGNPSFNQVLEKVKHGNFSEIVVLPLFPQYASSTTGTAVQEFWRIVRQWEIIPDVKVVSQFYDHPAFIQAFAEKIQSYHPETYDHVVFTYHGLPNRHLDKSHPQVKASQCNCEAQMPEHGTFCYKATCYETTRRLVQALSLPDGTWSVSFQSRLSNNWMTPFTDENLMELARQGKKKVLVAAPSFVADCLETTIEIGVEYGELFHRLGGEKLQMVESLNSDDKWIELLKEIVQER